ncbi:2,3,4,5-tetrahydropyridine-2,6-dicarboxylate N-acetyltransferase [Tetragenococcus koreensis]|uniref:2,3,4,5-tetrahydropyridine-2,6-dicarboxylate N-acetyltransferase n=1 Tax=Tetragenococcus koreensis TaxID=290335 RepID=A0AAN4UCU7_9ENTE|nr:2,3,4,5-tetrahydropyridine-2,6-dicarboxylate N-acetyltransferase [Tetragenococcus koreensis]AYW45646.1 2,3,4,5-tetrahydropyridine-2,6-dicarboxylate N-acetyltransferase [Tetragenococcus koreensis]MCF1586267.1 2,3,4,5-tetrahydropyridine-2,6-dicarboxylate N-acetyltransferase [Tetragenococcus koreensis]MCF1614831.1 2,3,4,5-tetrahydropyridine-2,6-dicarboxylate N-acetyltransferase [Tetragenococcus koreensis]MCF1617616.1 2,3,4,5-tetrahydropyridine-2,6-dicarboxylate N-acetyltransferase [Tetragenococ
MTELRFTDAYEIANYIKEAEKETPVKAYINGDLSKMSTNNVKTFGNLVIGNTDEIQQFLNENKELINDYYLENDRRNSAVPMLDLTTVDARIEPGAMIRDQVIIEKNAVVMMGAIINIGSVVGEETMIDMGAVLGARATVGKRAHIGAGAVLAGVLEPPSADPVIIEDNVLIGANSVILEGVRVGKDAIVAAGSVVTKDVEAGSVVGGTPAKVLKTRDEQTSSKTQFLDELRK